LSRRENLSIRPTKARTEHADCRFRVKEAADGTPWVSVEPGYGKIPAFEDALIGLRLRTGTTLDQAEAIAEFFNANVEGLGFTMFESHRYF